MGEIEKLTRRRGSFKAKLTSFTHYLESLEKTILIDNSLVLPESDITALTERLKNIHLTLKDFDSVQLQIEELADENNLDKEYNYRTDFENLFSSLVSRAHKLTPQSEQRVDENISHGISEAQSNNSSRPRSTFIKLPTIPLPQFDGSLIHWLDFRETFNSLIHNSESLGAVEKFHYLKSSVSKVPAEIISGLAFTPSNYDLAWELICDRFNNDRRLIDAHVEALFTLERPNFESASLLHNLLDGMNKHLRALKLLGQLTDSWDTLIIYLISHKFDAKTSRAWEEFKINQDILTIKNLTTFMQNRCELLSTINSKVQKSDTNPNKNKPQNSFKTKSFHVSTSTCPLCSMSHAIYNCEKLLGLSIKERISLVKSKNLCFNCLKAGHGTSLCRSSSCRKCNGKHNTLLHINNNNSQQITQVENNSIPSTSDSNYHNAFNENIQNYMLLSTAIVEVDQNNQLYHLRALLDSGSQSNFLTESVCDKLGLTKTKINHTVVGLNSSATQIKYQTIVHIKARHSNFGLDLPCLIVPKISDQLPSLQINTSSIQIPSNILLADPGFHTPGEINLLIGAGSFWNLMSIGQISLGNQMPVLQKTLLGWVISGPISTLNKSQLSTHCHFISNNSLQQQISKFWELESVPINNKHFSKEEAFCENHFIENTTRDSQGRFIVKIPFKENPEVLGNSHDVALKRFYSLERKLEKSINLKNSYHNFISEYINLGHMDLAPTSNQQNYFLPHHAVHKADSLSTKTRVVFDGSAKTSSGKSLNDLQAVGPVIQQDLFSILLRFRQHNVAITADITKMYRQVLIDQNQRSFQSILWRFNPSDNIQTYQLNTVTYGTSAASFLAIRSLQQTAYDNMHLFPNAAKTIIDDFYVDDLLTGASSSEEAKTLIKEIIQTLGTGCLELRKWVSNNPSCLSNIHVNSELTVLEIGNGERSKTLGLWWNPNTDAFQFALSLDDSKFTPTKRKVLSCIAQVFDPLGLLAPIVILFKKFMQSLWQAQITWDESLPHNLHTRWLDLYNTLIFINKLSIPRHVISTSLKRLELHGFADASQTAYGACLYLRSIDNPKTIKVHLLCAKTKVAPLKTVSIPRLELCAALLLAELSKRALDSLKLNFDHIHYWSDSTIVLNWIRTEPNKLQTFVANRVATIQTISSPESWSHVSTHDNPADLLSRGASPKELLISKIWWQGPTWLSLPVIPYVQFRRDNSISLDFKQQHTTTHISVGNLNFSFPFNRFSSLIKMQRTMAYMLRFLNLASKKRQNKGPLTATELNKALNTLLMIAQRESFANECLALSDGRPIDSKSNLIRLQPFMKNQLLRVGGRLDNSNFAYSKKHPIILDSKHLLTKLILVNEHIKLHHAGPQLLLASIRERFWPISGRYLARQIIRQCMNCFKVSPKSLEPTMGNLPADRLAVGHTFEVVGVDYAGPFTLKDRKGRGCKTSKAYVCLFVCFSSKAVHLELVTSLTTESFLLTLRRFIARRGKPTRIVSDNATNFVGAANEIKQLITFFNENEHSIINALSKDFIEWKFIPPGSPHFGGLWEAGVRSFKHHFRRVAKDFIFTYEEFYTLAVEIESIMNSRPLCPLSVDPNDLNPITPAHLLMGKSLVSLPDPSLKHLKMSTINRYQHLQRMRQHFWERWSKEYLSELQVRTKWAKCNSDINVGTLVLIKDNNLPPLNWRMGRILERHCGSDGVCRVVSIKTQKGVIKRACTKVCPLPLGDI